MSDRIVAPTVLTLTQAAVYLQMSKSHLSNVLRGAVAGSTPFRFKRVGRRILIKREWIDEWLETTKPEAAGKC